MNRGFTLLEMMAATVVMAIAVVGLLAGISSSMRNAGRLTDYDRAVLLARAKMGELVADRSLRAGAALEGRFDPSLTGAAAAGWRARISPFEAPPAAGPGSYVLERVELEVWWMAGERRRSLLLDGYRQAVMGAPEAP